MICGDLQRVFAPDASPDESGDKLATLPVDREMFDVVRDKVMRVE